MRIPTPGPGFHGFERVRRYLEKTCGTRLSSNKLKSMCAELGIELYPLVYEGRVHGRFLRWLTDVEVQRILELYHRRLEDRRERRSLRYD